MRSSRDASEAMINLNSRLHGAVLRTVFATATVFFAVSDDVRAHAADVELGRYLATECLTCHRAATGAAIPNIFGIAETTFAEVVKAYRSKQRENPVMQTIAGRLKDDEIEALAAYFAITKRP